MKIIIFGNLFFRINENEILFQKFQFDHIFKFKENLIARIKKRVAESETKRADDNDDTIKKRIEVFTKNAEEVLSQYPNKTIRVNSDGHFF